MAETNEEKEYEEKEGGAMIGFMVPQAMKAKLDAVAKADGRTMSGWIRKALQDALETLELNTSQPEE